MKKVIRLTESDLVRIVKRVISEQTQDFDHFGKIVYPQMKQNGFKFVDESKGSTLKWCKYANGICCKYFCYPDHNTGVNLFLDCKDGGWEYVVYYGNNKDMKRFPIGGNDSSTKSASQDAVTYALNLKNRYYK